MGLAIAIMVALFVGLLVDALYEAPEYDDFCEGDSGPRADVKEPLLAKDECADPYFVYQEEIDECHKDEGYPDFKYDEKGCRIYDNCNFCGKEYGEANEKYNRNIFYIISPIGLIAIIFGVLYGFEIVGSGFMFGGILLLIYSTARYFSDMSKVIAGVGLASYLFRGFPQWLRITLGALVVSLIIVGIFIHPDRGEN